MAFHLWRKRNGWLVPRKARKLTRFIPLADRMEINRLHMLYPRPNGRRDGF